jgi:thiol peroxidase
MPTSVTFKGNPVTLAGDPPAEGQLAPDFTALDAGLQPVSLSSFRGAPVVLNVVPSLDTPVCERQTRHLAEQASTTGFKLVTLSMDLPFAQKRFCETFQLPNVVTLSDFKDRQAGQRWGLELRELGLLARAVFVLDSDGVIRHRQIVPEIAQEPNYAPVLETVKSLL